MKASLRNTDSRNTLTRRQVIARGVTMTGVLCLAGEQTFAQVSAKDENLDSNEDSSDTAKATGLTYESPKIQRWKFGLRLSTPVKCTNVMATFVVPMNWPEQKITPVTQTIDSAVTGWEIRPLQKGAQQVALQMGRVSSGATVEVSFEVDIERTRIFPPEQIDTFSIPARLPRSLRVFMGNSPNIDTNNSRIKKASRDLAAQPAENGWDRVEQIYDFVRDEVEYVEGPIRSASDALKTGKGDCEDMTSLFVALCRNQRIPARMVWIPDHCYPEFYLEDASGQGTWFPCQAAGTRQFGRMDEYRPILQKGDRFKVVESRTLVRYVSEYFKCDRKGKKNPRPTFIREMIDV